MLLVCRAIGSLVGGESFLCYTMPFLCMLLLTTGSSLSGHLVLGYSLLCYSMRCYLRYAMRCYALLCFATLSYAMLCHALLQHNICFPPCCGTLRYSRKR